MHAWKLILHIRLEWNRIMIPYYIGNISICSFNYVVAYESVCIVNLYVCVYLILRHMVATSSTSARGRSMHAW